MSTTLLTISGPSKEIPSFHFSPQRFKLTDSHDEYWFSQLRQELSDPKVPEKIRRLYGCLTCFLANAQEDLKVELDTFRFVPSKSENPETLIPFAYCSLLTAFLNNLEKTTISPDGTHLVPNCEDFSIILNFPTT